jgi:hypothetical protein
MVWEPNLVECQRVSAEGQYKSGIRFSRNDAAMSFLMFAPQVLLWLSAALVTGVGGFWLSYIGTCATNSILGDVG